MKRKTSITLAPELAVAIDRLAVGSSRSAVVERAVREYVARQARLESDRHDRKILDQKASRLNREAREVLAFQDDP